MLRISHCLHNRLKDGGKVLRLTHPSHFTPHNHYYFYVSSARGSGVAILAIPYLTTLKFVAIIL
jgi:hypothetical protein